MGSENEDLVQAWFERLQHGDPAPELCHEDVVIRNWDESPVRGPYVGRDGVLGWWADFADVLEDARFELLEAHDLGDGRVLTVNRLDGRFRLTGITLVDAVWGSIITVRDGKIAGATGYATPGRAKKAAGFKDR